MTNTKHNGSLWGLVCCDQTIIISCYCWIVTVIPGLCNIFPFIMFTKESLVFVGSIELQYIPPHHSYIIPRELETSGKVLFHQKHKKFL